MCSPMAAKQKDMVIEFTFIQHIVQNLLFYGGVSLFFGILILIYPDLLGILVGILLVILAIQAFRFAYKLHKYSRIKL